MRKRYKNETRGLKILIEQEIGLETKKRKTEDKINEYRILMDIIITEVEDLKIRVINKLNETK